MANYTLWKSAAPGSTGATEGCLNVEVNFADQSVASGSTFDICDVAAGTIIDSVEMVTKTAVTHASGTIAVADSGSTKTFLTAAAPSGTAGTVAYTPEVNGSTNKKYYHTAVTLRGTVATQTLSAGKVVFCIKYRIVTPVAKTNSLTAVA